MSQSPTPAPPQPQQSDQPADSTETEASTLPADDHDDDDDDSAAQPPPQPGPKRPSTRLLDLLAGWLEMADGDAHYSEAQSTALGRLYQEVGRISFDGDFDHETDGQVVAAFIRKRVVQLIQTRAELTHLLAGWHQFIVDESEHAPRIHDTVHPDDVQQLRDAWAADADGSVQDFVLIRVISLVVS